MNQNTVEISFGNNELAQRLFGVHDECVKMIERRLRVRARVKGNEISLTGRPEDVELARKLLHDVYGILCQGQPILPTDIDCALRILTNDRKANIESIFLDVVYTSASQRTITPKSVAQKRYVDGIRKFDIVFGIGPAGTGKTYLAMAMALSALVNKRVNRIILTRPAVEAGETLGFLPGDIFEKVNPYLRPLYDALHDMMTFEKAARLVETGVIEAAPLAFMRGRTLNDAFVILDEAQNTTSEQMKMFLTRLGINSKTVITGDVTQVDLPSGKTSGLIEVQDVLRGIEGIGFIYFTEQDVVRHRLVQDIITAYDRKECKDKTRPGSAVKEEAGDDGRVKE